MKVISFPGCHRPDAQQPEGLISELSETDQRRIAFIQSMEPLTTPDVLQQDSQSVRAFALSVAEKLRCDPELNSQAPLLVDKVVMMLVKESRS